MLTSEVSAQKKASRPSDDAKGLEGIEGKEIIVIMVKGPNETSDATAAKCSVFLHCNPT